MFERLRRRMIRQNRIYIMPTFGGVMMLALIVVMILTAATYNNNLIFVLAFFLFSLFVVSMLQTHYNLKGARLEYVGSEEAFEGQPLGMLFHVVQAKARTKRSLEIRLSSKLFKNLSRRRETLRSQDRLKPMRIEVLAWRRGVHLTPDVVLQTTYPLGIFRAWKVFRPDGELVVYPKPEGDRPLFADPFAEGEEDAGLRTSPDGDFGELKNYVIGESYHQIAWKHFARTRMLYTKVHWGAENKHYRLIWDPSLASNMEGYLSQMSAWVEKALLEGASFEMETPSLKVEPGSGSEQARMCWRALAFVDSKPGKTG